jgi:hypothetical protein
MYRDILIKEQFELLPIIRDYSKDYYMVGGTAIALHIGHRRSIDFDLFTIKDVKRKSIKNYLKKNYEDKIIYGYEDYEQLHFKINNVKFTFFKYPYTLENFVWFENIIKIPTLLELAAMKASALGGRAKWKDYVDLYFIFKDHFSLQEISIRAEELFGNLYNEKLFRQQICYFKDIDYTEEVDFIKEKPSKEEILNFLTEVSLTKFN